MVARVASRADKNFRSGSGSDSEEKQRRDSRRNSRKKPRHPWPVDGIIRFRDVASCLHFRVKTNFSAGTYFSPTLYPLHPCGGSSRQPNTRALCHLLRGREGSAYLSRSEIQPFRQFAIELDVCHLSA